MKKIRLKNISLLISKLINIIIYYLPNASI